MKNTNAHLKSPAIKPSCRLDLLALLKKRDYTSRELALLVDRHPDTIAALLRTLRGHVYIKAWRRDRGAYEAIWAYGDRPYADKPRIKPRSPYRPTEKKLDALRLSSPYVTSERIWGI